MKSTQWSLLILVLACPATTARADVWDWIWQGPDCAPNTSPRQARPEYQCENKKARYLGYLDCGGLAFVAESQRQAVNQQALGAYMRPYSSFGTSSASAPAAASLPPPPPTTAPNANPAPSTAPVPPPPPSPSPSAAVPAPVTSSPVPPPAPVSTPSAAPLPPR